MNRLSKSNMSTVAYEWSHQFHSNSTDLTVIKSNYKDSMYMQPERAQSL